MSGHKKRRYEKEEAIRKGHMSMMQFIRLMNVFTGATVDWNWIICRTIRNNQKRR